MRSVRFHRHGGPEVLRYEEAPDPDLAPGEALVRVRACALNHLDLWQRRGLPRVTIPMPHISGSDVAGEVVAATAPDIAVGRRVMLQPGMSCGRCEAGLSRLGAAWGRQRFKSHFSTARASSRRPDRTRSSSGRERLAPTM